MHHCDFQTVLKIPFQEWGIQQDFLGWKGRNQLLLIVHGLALAVEQLVFYVLPHCFTWNRFIIEKWWHFFKLLPQLSGDLTVHFEKPNHLSCCRNLQNISMFPGSCGQCRTTSLQHGMLPKIDDFVDDDQKWVTVYCASATSKFRRHGVTNEAKQSRITSSWISTSFGRYKSTVLSDFWSPLHFLILVNPAIVPFFS